MLILLVLLAACSSCVVQPPGPTLVIRTDPAYNAADRQAIETSAAAWVRLGIGWMENEEAKGLPPCPRDWATIGERGCMLEVYVEPADLTGKDYDGLQESGLVTIGQQWHGWSLTEIAAHEFGHVLGLPHLAVGKVGVMQARGAQWNPTADDYALACDVIRLCAQAE